MNELKIHEIPIFIEKDSYINYMYTPITHMKQRRKVHELFWNQ